MGVESINTGFANRVINAQQRTTLLSMRSKVIQNIKLWKHVRANDQEKFWASIQETSPHNEFQPLFQILMIYSKSQDISSVLTPLSSRRSDLSFL